MGETTNADISDNNAPPKRGFHIWKVLCLALLLGGSIISWMLLNEFRENRLIQKAERLYEGVQGMEELTLAQISQQAHHTTAARLIESPNGLDDRFVVLDGNVCKEESIAISANMANEIFRGQNYTTYVLDDQVVFVDISGESTQFAEGDHVQGHGKVFVLRIGDLFGVPILGEDLQREFGDSLNEDDQVIFFLSKGVQLLDQPQMEFAGSNPDGTLQR
jgi:hypothetical protein